jgi:hypothetical protein
VDTLQQAVAVVAVAVFPFDVDHGGDAVAAVAKSVTNHAAINAIHPQVSSRVQLVPYPLDGEPYC